MIYGDTSLVTVIERMSMSEAVELDRTRQPMARASKLSVRKCAPLSAAAVWLTSCAPVLSPPAYSLLSIWYWFAAVRVMRKVSVSSELLLTSECGGFAHQVGAALVTIAWSCLP